MLTSERHDPSRLRRFGLLGTAATLIGTPTAALLLTSAATAGASPRTLTVDTLADGVAVGTDCTTPVADSCSLRDALAAAASGDTITFAAGLTGTITSTQGQFLVTTSTTITGPGPAMLTVSGNSLGRVFYVTATADDVEISGLTITGGINDSVAGIGGRGGGGVLALNSGDMVVRNCSVSGNATTGDGRGAGGVYFGNRGVAVVESSTIDSNSSESWTGGLYFGGEERELHVMNSTISNNTSTGGAGGIGGFGVVNSVAIVNSTIVGNSTGIYGGGGILLYETNEITVLFSTITGNSTSATATGSAGGFEFLSYVATGSVPSSASSGGRTPSGHSPTDFVGSATIIGSIISGNTSGDTNHADFGTVDSEVPTFLLSHSLWGAGGPFTDATGNVQSSTPGLAPLANNGGPTKTMALLTGSPAIDSGPTTIPPFPGDQWDQRGPGYARVVNGRVDMGAFELQNAEPVKPAFTG